MQAVRRLTAQSVVVALTLVVAGWLLLAAGGGGSGGGGRTKCDDPARGPGYVVAIMLLSTVEQTPYEIYVMTNCRGSLADTRGRIPSTGLSTAYHIQPGENVTVTARLRVNWGAAPMVHAACEIMIDQRRAMRDDVSRVLDVFTPSRRDVFCKHTELG